jgi:hypothetical protein
LIKLRDIFCGEKRRNRSATIQTLRIGKNSEDYLHMNEKDEKIPLPEVNLKDT